MVAHEIFWGQKSWELETRAGPPKSACRLLLAELFSLHLPSMEPQIPMGKESQGDPRKKTPDMPPPALATAAEAASSSNMLPLPPPTARVQNPTPSPTSSSVAEQTADQGNAGEPRKEGGEGAEQKGPKHPATGTTAVGPSSATALAAAAGAATDLQKKLRRAERFGMPVLLTEEEKRNSRAER